jgi:hypothetical protein
MAAGDTKAYNDYVLNTRIGKYSVTDSWALSFTSNTYASLNTDITNPTTANVTITSGGNVLSAYPLSSVTATRSGNVITFDAGDIGAILKDGANPSDLRTAVLYNATSGNELAQVWDMTADGTTALDLASNDFTFSFNASGINTSTNNSA